MPTPGGRTALAEILEDRLARFERSGGRDLVCVEDEEQRALPLEGRPLVLLGCGSLIAQPFVRHALDRCDVRALVDNARAGARIGRWTVRTDEALGDLARAEPDLLAVVCAFGHAGLAHFRARAAAAGLPALTLPQALRRAGLLTPDEPSDWLRAGHPGVTAAVLRRVLEAGFFREPASLEALRAVALYRLSWNPRWLEGVARPAAEAYAGPGTLDIAPDEVIVDAGAFDGDTAMQFHRLSGGAYGRIHCFEPDPANFAALRAATAALPRVTAHQAGLWSSSGRLAFDGGGTHGSRVAEDGSSSIAVVALDDRPDLAPSFIKMDIEGAELPALLGARRTIATRRPKLALSAYHRPEDLFALPAAITALRPDYSLRLRHHSDGLFDTVLYAA